jgi:ligand-binding sensor domain-containing protein
MKKRALGFFLLLLLAGPGFSQVPFFQRYYLLRKNEPVQVLTTFQDKSGFLWLGTNRGLFRFDGKNYLQFTVKDSLPDNQVTAIAQDSAGRIWTGHKNGKLAYQTGKIFQEFEPDEGSATQAVSDILFDRKGVLWFSTLNDGLYYFRNDRLYRLDDLEGMPDLFVYDIQEDDSGRIWAGTDGGVAICSMFRDSINITTLNSKSGLPDNIVKKIRIDEDQTIWLATEDAGIIRYSERTQQFSPLIPEGWPNGSVTDFVIKGGQFWIAAQQSLIVHHVKSGITKKYNIQSGYDVGSIITLYKDREGSIWAGTKTGMIRTSGDRLEFISDPNPEGDRNVLALAVDQASNIWFSTKDGLFKRTLSGAVEKQLTTTALKNFSVISLFVDEAGYVWAGLYGEGLLRIDPRSGKIQHFNKELRNGNVLSITGKGNVIWLATLGGAEKISSASGKFTFENFNSQKGLSSDFIYQVFIDSKNHVWFATDGKGADRLDETGLHAMKGLSGKVVYGFAEDQSGTLWANVQNEGIFSFNGNEFSSGQGENKLLVRDNTIQTVSSDKSGNLVLMHDQGIDVYDARTNTFRYFGEESGIQNRRAHLNAITRDASGSLLIGTDEGMIRCDVAEEGKPVNPQVLIESIRINGKQMDISTDLVLAHDQNNLTMHFLAFWYENPERIDFLYRMDNYDAGWILTGDNTATYSQLPPGEYSFRLKSAGSASGGMGEETDLHFTIRPPFWRTVAFYVICVVLLLTGGYLTLKFRERKLKRDKVELEAKVEERTREIQRKTEEIQAQNEEIMAQAEEINGINENLEMLVNERTAELEKKNHALEEYAFINAHKLRSPVASILGLANLLKKTPLNDEGKAINKHLQQSAEELDNVVRSITEAIERGEK